MSRVFFITDETRFDTTPAEEYGERMFVYDRTSYCPWSDPDKLAREALRFLSENRFDPEYDHIALTGPATPLSVFTAVVLAAYETINVLIFNARAEKYRPRTLNARLPSGEVPGVPQG